MSDVLNCTGTKKDGTPCIKKAMKGTDRCLAHTDKAQKKNRVASVETDQKEMDLIDKIRETSRELVCSCKKLVKKEVPDAKVIDKALCLGKLICDLETYRKERQSPLFIGTEPCPSSEQ